MLPLRKNDNAEKNPLWVYEDTQTEAKVRFLSALCKEPMGTLANKCNFFRDSLAEFSTCKGQT